MEFRSLSQLNLHEDNAAVRVRILQLWRTMKPDGVQIHQLHMLLLDNEGTEMQGLVSSVNVPEFQPILQAGRIYVFRNFVVRSYHGHYRVSPSTRRICFSDDTLVEEVANAHDIPTYNFRFLAAADLPQAVHNHAYMSDIIGEVVAAGPEQALFEDVAVLRRKTVDLRLIEGDIVEVILWDGLIDQFQELMPHHPGPGTTVVFTSVVVQHFNGQHYCVGSNATKLYCNLHYPHQHPLLNNIENALLAIDYTLEEALGVSIISSISELNMYKTDINNQGIYFIVDAQVKDVNIFWSPSRLKFMVQLNIHKGSDEVVVMFMTSKFRWIASRIIEGTDREWTQNFSILLESLRGQSFKLMVELGGFNQLTNEFDVVLRKLFW
ncbi:unnamed protein product [Linum trigynum]|uniref:Replication protein A 70 kDa DNA-binding subunit B/D first OB fold domain-containing protein n=1 Tax=Linum trigynum TaxID=586398 RepID=A0AAV2GR53_9ROSI